jgi:hypothetical protein
MSDYVLIDGDKAIFRPRSARPLVVVQPGKLAASGPATLGGARRLRRRRREQRVVPGCMYMTPAHDPRHRHPRDRRPRRRPQGPEDEAPAASRCSSSAAPSPPASRSRAPPSSHRPAPAAPIPDAAPEYSGSGFFVTTNASSRDSDRAGAKPLSTSGRDGTSQRDRRLPALDPDSVAIDERGHADLLAFVQALAASCTSSPPTTTPTRPRRRTWAALRHRPDLPIADIVAYMADPQRASAKRARWLGRPHFALLLGLPRAARPRPRPAQRPDPPPPRSLLPRGPAPGPEPAVPDRVVVLLRLAARVDAARAARRHRVPGRPRQPRRPADLPQRARCPVSRARIDGLRAVTSTAASPASPTSAATAASNDAVRPHADARPRRPAPGVARPPLTRRHRSRPDLSLGPSSRSPASTCTSSTTSCAR